MPSWKGSGGWTCPPRPCPAPGLASCVPSKCLPRESVNGVLETTRAELSKTHGGCDSSGRSDRQGGVRKTTWVLEPERPGSGHSASPSANAGAESPALSAGARGAPRPGALGDGGDRARTGAEAGHRLRPCPLQPCRGWRAGGLAVPPSPTLCRAAPRGAVGGDRDPLDDPALQRKTHGSRGWGSTAAP